MIRRRSSKRAKAFKSSRGFRSGRGGRPASLTSVPEQIWQYPFGKKSYWVTNAQLQQVYSHTPGSQAYVAELARFDKVNKKTYKKAGLLPPGKRRQPTPLTPTAGKPAPGGKKTVKKKSPKRPAKRKIRPRKTRPRRSTGVSKHRPRPRKKQRRRR